MINLVLILQTAGTFRECCIVIPNTKKRVEKTMCSRVFLTNFEVFGNVMKHSFMCLVYLLNQN